jgi:DNA sulfur modification protein DndC
VQEKLKEIEEEIADQYLNDENPRPWIIGFSGGKDSTMLLQLAWNAILNIPKKQRTRKVYIICNNTLVENPQILKYTEVVLQKIQSYI